MLKLFRWGCSHEKEALEVYRQLQLSNHTNLKMEDVGLFISTEKPYIGAFPDSIVVCDCCGRGTVEVKCPFCFKEELPNDNSSDFCMKINDSGMYY